MRPPRRLFTAAALSRPTPLPPQPPRRLDLFSVSPITSAVKAPSRTHLDDRQAHAVVIVMEWPCPASEVTTGPRIVNRAESPRSSLPTISPISSTIPVNTPPDEDPRILPDDDTPKVQLSRHVPTPTRARPPPPGQVYPLRLTHADPPLGELLRRALHFCRSARRVFQFRGQLEPCPTPRHCSSSNRRDHEEPDKRTPAADNPGRDPRHCRSNFSRATNPVTRGRRDVQANLLVFWRSASRASASPSSTATPVRRHHRRHLPGLRAGSGYGRRRGPPVARKCSGTISNFSDPKAEGREDINGVKTVRVTGKQQQCWAPNAIAPPLAGNPYVPGTAFLSEEGNHELMDGSPRRGGARASR